MIFAGIDAGSRAIKVALLDETSHVIGTGVQDQGVEQVELASGLLNRVLQEHGYTRSDVGGSVATGYGRDALLFANTTITEITCQAQGVCYSMPEARTIIDIGGQDSKVIRLEAEGHVRDFVMNDRCAAGTGRFLEVVSQRLNVALSEIGSITQRVDAPAFISSMCVVFAETEIIGLMSRGVPREQILAGVQKAMSARVASMAGRSAARPVVFTGGVAMIPGMDAHLSNALGHTVLIAPFPQMTAALGAAILAVKRFLSKGLQETITAISQNQ